MSRKRVPPPSDDAGYTPRSRSEVLAFVAGLAMRGSRPTDATVAADALSELIRMAERRAVA